jgi:hypothetical protein
VCALRSMPSTDLNVLSHSLSHSLPQARNVLIDSSFMAKVADFGLTRPVLDEVYVSPTGQIPVRKQRGAIDNPCF